jgi:hypothetical protein
MLLPLQGSYKDKLLASSPAPSARDQGVTRLSETVDTEACTGTFSLRAKNGQAMYVASVDGLHSEADASGTLQLHVLEEKTVATTTTDHRAKTWAEAVQTTARAEFSLLDSRNVQASRTGKFNGHAADVSSAVVVTVSLFGCSPEAKRLYAYLCNNPATFETKNGCSHIPVLRTLTQAIAVCFLWFR